MTDTNDSRQPVSQVPLGLRNNLHVARNRHHVEHLLASRNQLADLTVQRFRHESLDAMETFELLLAVEATIERLYPAVSRMLYASWIELDVTPHPAMQTTASCLTCSAKRNPATSSSMPIAA